MMNKEVLRTNIKSSTKNAKDVGVLKFHIPSRMSSEVIVAEKKTIKTDNVATIKEEPSVQVKLAPIAHILPKVPTCTNGVTMATLSPPETQRS